MYLKKIIMMKKGYVQVQCFLRVYFVVETVENFEVCERLERLLVITVPMRSLRESHRCSNRVSVHKKINS